MCGLTSHFMKDVERVGCGGAERGLFDRFEQDPMQVLPRYVVRFLTDVEKVRAGWDVADAAPSVDAV